MNFDNTIVEIKRKKKFAVDAIQLLKHERSSEKKFGNMIAEI